MDNQTTFEKIQQATGRKSSSCACNSCRMQCTKTPCLGTPEDILKLIMAGYGERLAVTVWAAGILMGVTERPVEIIAPLYDASKRSCTFFNNGQLYRGEYIINSDIMYPMFYHRTFSSCFYNSS